MSDYVRNKQVMYPVKEEDLKEIGVEDFDEFYDYVDEHRNCGDYKLEVEYMSGKSSYNKYLAITLFSSYGDECGDFGKSRFLSETEQAKFIPVIRTIIPNADPKKLKYVDYCYYNCSESDDYYEEDDDFNKEL